MGITKIGRTLQNDVNIGKKIFTYGYNNFKKLKPIVSVPYGIAKGVGKAGLGTANAIGKGVANNPRTGLILGTGAVYAANTIPGKFTRNLAHTDPNQHFTYADPFRQKIRMVDKDPMAKTYMQAQNRIF